MPRPFRCRRIDGEPASEFFKPVGIPLAVLEVVTLAVDEFEAVRLADLEGLYQEDAAQRMGISRQTFGRIVESAHRKIAEALVAGKAIKIKGGAIEVAKQRPFRCADCHHAWHVPYGTGRPAACPKCQSPNIRRTPESQAQAHRKAGGQGAKLAKGMRRRQRGGSGSPQANHKGGNY